MVRLLLNLTAISVGVSVVATSASAFADNSATHQPAQKSQTIAAAETDGTTSPSSSQPVIVSVQPGEYLEKIAQANNSTSLRLFYANQEIVNPDLIYPDQKLRIPAADEALTPREVPVNQQIATPTPDESSQAATPSPSYRAAAAPAAAPNYASGSSVWDRLAACESGGNWSINTGNGFYGGLQFSLSSWQGVGGSGLPSDASRDEQIARAQILQSRQGWGAWPACTARLGIS